MRDEAFKHLLDREGVGADLSAHFSHDVDLLEEIVNYGTNLVPRAWRSSPRGLAELVAIPFLLRNVVAMGDAMHLLQSSGAVYGSQAPLRALFESLLSLKWLLKGDREQKAKCFYVWYLERRLREHKFLIKQETQSQEFTKSLAKSDILLPPEEIRKLHSFAEEEANELRRVLSEAAYQPIRQLFATNKRRYKNWYSPTGPQNIRELAEEVGLGPLYDGVYVGLSAIAHASALDQGLTFKGNAATFTPIRSLERLPQEIRFAATLLMAAYRTVLEAYRPEEIVNFNRKYATEWRVRLLSPKHVVLRPDNINIDDAF